MSGSMQYQAPETGRPSVAAPLPYAEDVFDQPYGNEAMQDQIRIANVDTQVTPQVGGPTSNSEPVPDVMALRSAGHGLDDDSVRAVQARLAELNYAVPVTGQMDAVTTAALERFQVEHADEITQVVEDARQSPYNIHEATYSGKDHRPVSSGVIAGMNIATHDPVHRDASGQITGASGRIQANDATNQVLANTWRGANDAQGNVTEGRRRINGQLMTEQETFNYLTAQMSAQQLNFEDGLVNVLGVRGQEGGVRNNNAGVFTSENAYNDTMYMLSRDDDQHGHVEMFRASLDPGVGPNDGFQVQSGQQWDYRMTTRGAGPKYNRPWLNPTMERDNEANVLDPTRGTDPQSNLRVLNHNGNVVEQADRFAMHSGGNGSSHGEMANGDSNGCQVVHGAWYGHYMESMQRGMAQDDQNRRGEIGRIRYTLMDADQLQTPPTQ